MSAPTPDLPPDSTTLWPLATVTTWSAVVMVTVAWLVTEEADALIVAVAGNTGAVNSPADVIDPPPVAAQAMAGCVVSRLPNWSAAAAVNCSVVPATIDAVAGDTAIAVRVWTTVTLTVDVATSPPESLIVAVST